MCTYPSVGRRSTLERILSALRRLLGITTEALRPLEPSPDGGPRPEGRLTSDFPIVCMNSRFCCLARDMNSWSVAPYQYMNLKPTLRANLFAGEWPTPHV